MVSKKKTMLHTVLTAVIFMACLLMPGMCSAQPGDWTWMGGKSQIDATGVYGRKGAPAPANVPGSRNGSISWMDVDGNMWLFGGLDCFDCDNEEDREDRLWNDLWSYDSVTEEWTWMSGSNIDNQTGFYGTMGEPDGANIPGARHSSVSWVDKDGDLWLFGGDGFDNSTIDDFDNSTIDGCDNSTIACLLNDLWHYDIATKNWKWVSGSRIDSQSGVYVDKGFPNEDNVPGARRGSVSWIDKDGYMWLFGGYGFDGNGSRGLLNDLWIFDSATREWAWVSGSDKATQAGVYGTMGEANESNVPGARESSISWIDSSGNLWLFGGYGFDSTGNEGHLSDLWRYDPVEKNWTWVSGSDMHSQIGIYDIIGAPGCREDSISWIDKDGYLWLFGGFGLASTYSPIGGRLNDLWRYDPGEENWTWVSGSNFMNQAGVYGTLGIPGTFNVPGARRGSIPWIDSLGYLWLFGGLGFDGDGAYGNLNDLWNFETSPDCKFDEECEDDDLFCTGAPRCWDGVCGFEDDPCSGNTPVCDETGNTCVECLNDSDCSFDHKCIEAMCVNCGLDIKPKALSSAELYKDTKITFKILTVAFGGVDLGPDIQIVGRPKTNTKNGIVKVKTIVPAGLRPQIIPVRVGDCYGEIEITE